MREWDLYDIVDGWAKKKSTFVFAVSQSYGMKTA
jgi:hypothetical protein